MTRSVHAEIDDNRFVSCEAGQLTRETLEAWVSIKHTST